MRRSLTLMAVLLLGAALAGGSAAAVPRPVDRLFLEDRSSPEKPFLVDPGSLTLGPGGRLAVWDRGLGRFFRFDVAPEDPPGKGSSWSPVAVMKRQETVRARRLMGFDGDPGSIWDHRGRLWTYDPKVASRAGTVPLRALDASGDVRFEPGPIGALQAGETGWFIQFASGSDDLLRRGDPGGTSDTEILPLDLRGRLVGVGPGPRFYTREGDRLHAYDRSGRVATHSFVNLQTVAVDGESVFVLAGENRIVEANARLAVQFTYYFARPRRFRDLAVHRRTAYLAGEEGLFRSPLDSSTGSFFSSSSTLRLEELAGSLPDRYEREYARRIQLIGGETYPRLSLPLSDERVLEVGFDGRRLNRAASPRPLAQAPLGQFHRPGGPRGYQGPLGRFYYYFPDRGLVESYDTAAENRRRTRVEFDSFELVKDIDFLGADPDRILFRGRVMDPERGLRRALLIYGWQGELERVVHLHHPEGRARLAADTRPVSWRYDGHGHVYALHERYLQAYDLQGYPAGVLTGVTRPRDVVRRGEHLFVLDMRGWRVSAYRQPETLHTRFASPPDYPRVSGAAPVDDGRTILSARTEPSGRHQILEYDDRTRTYQAVFQHPHRSLRYPVSAPGGDTLFFWGRRGADRPWTLYRSDLRKYAAGTTGQQAPVRGPGFYSESHNMLLIPVETRSSTAPRYHYLYPGRGQAPLRGSQDLQHLKPGGFIGYYGVQRVEAGDALVAGYLSLPSDTSGWHWNVSDTLLVSPRPIRGLVPRGNRVYLSVESRPGFTRLGRYDVSSSAEAGQRTDGPGAVRWLHESRGRLRWIRPGRSDPTRVLHRPLPSRGYLADLYAPSTLRTGGLQGRLQSREPADLEGVPLRVEPGGQLIETATGGQFSRGGVPEGYVRIVSRSHRHHLAARDWMRVKPGEFTVPASVPVILGEELVLLERGLSYYREDRERRALISLQAFLELVQEGPSHHWAGALLETLHWSRGDRESLVRLFRQRPSLFSPSERLRLIASSASGSVGRNLYAALDPGWDPAARRTLGYLRARSGLEPGGKAPVVPPVLLGPAEEGLPVLGTNR